MKYTRELNGVERLKNARNYSPGSKCYKERKFKKREESEDTRIRKDINKTIMDMLDQNKCDIEIEIYLRNIYPNYAEYIAKMISNRISKLKGRNLVENSKQDIGDER